MPPSIAGNPLRSDPGYAAIRDILVAGAGPTGLLSALALADTGAEVTLIGPPAVTMPGRTVALFAGSIELLINLDVWPACAPESAAISGIRLVDDTGGLLRAPETQFTAADAAREQFGFNIPNDALVAALQQAVDRQPRIRRIGSAVGRVEVGTDAVELQLADGSALGGRLLVAADGRHSICRAAAGIETRTWAYPQTAMVASFRHSRPHRGISTELHRRAGPLTVVPLPGQRSSLVWVEKPEKAQAIAALDDAAFIAELEKYLQGLLGSISDVRGRGAFSLSGLTPVKFAANRVALVGETAHVFPPIGAQGLNLGMRDVAVLADLVAAALSDGRDPGSPELTTAYDAARQADVTTRTIAVDLLDRSLLAGLLPVDLLRGVALHAVGALGPLREIVVRQGLGPPGPLPSLMRPRSA